MRWAVLFFLAISIATAANAECDCDTSLPVFAEDPLVFADEGLVSYVTPSMVWKSDNGECAVENPEGFYEGSSEGTFFFGSEEYSQIQIYTANDFSQWHWATMTNLNDWATQICESLGLTS